MPTTDDDMEDDGSEEESSDDQEQASNAKRNGRRATSRSNQSTRKYPSVSDRRTSSRATKFTSSMAEPTDAAFRSKLPIRHESSDSNTSIEDEVTPVKKRRGRPPAVNYPSPQKSPARRHLKARLALQHQPDDESSSDDTSESEEEADDEEPLKIHRILASRTETLAKWKEICLAMQTTEIESGSRWFQNDDLPVDADNVFEERFLVKWKDLSYLHVSWETQADLENFTDGHVKALAAFFKKMRNGILLSADERCDGDYFDPAWTQIDRILEIELPNDDCPALTLDNEDTCSPSDFGVVLDRLDEGFDEGTGRQFLVKWKNQAYSDASWEFERDLVLNELDYKDDVKTFIRRNTKPAKSVLMELLRAKEKEKRFLYKIFGDRSTINDETKEQSVNKFTSELQDHEFKNGGHLRDYQAEGVAWIVSNYVNRRSCILADEMGLGKTLQTAASIFFLWDLDAIHANGPVLIIAPLSTLAHWQREFLAWTDLNVVVYYGSSEDRQVIRELDFAYQVDRPDRPVGMNQLYLKKCGQRKPVRGDSPWMAQVVITTPEMLIADDSAELTAVEWECLVVDEAHRLKNQSSKLAVKLRDPKFTFKFKLLLTGTPIQNDVQEFWTLLNFIDPEGFDDASAFAGRYGDLKSKESIDELHEEIRPYILRRLKEDVEKSVPPKEETLIEIELTSMQKQYYRALYEKNVAFLNKNKKKAMDAPSLVNLAMQLRKCCNHTYLLNGVEEDIRAIPANRDKPEADLLVEASGKLVLLDKLLPRLREDGHRVLVFSQFKIMLDILEDYFEARNMLYERIDGSITGHKRQRAIDRFQASPVEGRESPFIMMLSTRAGGVGINLTKADTVIIFDSDFNPQQDVQAMARCHRIGQTKSVKVYRLLTRKTYEMQMFHMASLKMGLDQAVLTGFEAGASGEGALSKDEVEKLLRNGAYEIFKEDKDGRSEEMSNEFIQQDIDSILQRHARTVVHGGTGSDNRPAAGSTFSKASFKVAKSPDASGKVSSSHEDVDVDDPDFWTKLLGKPVETDAADLLSVRRERAVAGSYAENAFTAELDGAIFLRSEAGDENHDVYAADEDDEDDGGGEDYDNCEGSRWGGSPEKNEWRKDDAETLVKLLLRFGYDSEVYEKFCSLSQNQPYSRQEVLRMQWSSLFVVLREIVADVISRRQKQSMASKSVKEDALAEGGVLANTERRLLSPEEESAVARDAFNEVWAEHKSWLTQPLNDAISFARSNQPRDSDTIEKVLRPETWNSKADTDSAIATSYAQTWQSLKNRGWKATVLAEGDKSGKTKYEYQGKQYWTQEAVIEAASKLHSDLEQACERILELQRSHRSRSTEEEIKELETDFELTTETATDARLRCFLERYGCMQLLADRKKATKISLPKRILKTCAYMRAAKALVNESQADADTLESLASKLVVDKRSKLPHPLWNSRHDAVLVLAIACHGWIDSESSCRAIADDSSIRWGAPFEKAAVGAQHLEYAEESLPDIVATAYRAAEFLNTNSECLDDLKGISVNELKRVYGLIRQHDEEHSALDFDSHSPWTVDEAALEAAYGSPTSLQGPEDLPPPKDLLSRAKLLLTRCLNKAYTTVASAVALEQGIERTAYPFSVLDQRQRCNSFLAELLRGLLSAPSKKFMSKKKSICTIARKEAATRADTIQSTILAGAESNLVLLKALSDMSNIAKHIDLVNEHIGTKKSTPYKNVLRVILGEDPAQVKSGEELFPAYKVAPREVLQSLGGSEIRTSPKSSGEQAIEAACRKLDVLKRGNDKSGRGELLDLTEVENHILRVACDVGLPPWRADGQVHVNELDPEMGSTSDVSWVDFSLRLVQTSNESLQQEEEKLMRVEQMAARTLGNSAQLLLNARRRVERKKAACGQAEDFLLSPEGLAKKTIMMLTRLLSFAQKHPSTSVVASSGTVLSPSVYKWMEQEVHRWSRSFELLDNHGNPLGFTAADFLDDLGDEERASFESASCFDVRGSRTVLEQIALLSRLRNIFHSTVMRELTGRISTASEAVPAAKWELGPRWWSYNEDGRRQSSGHDMLLLQRLIRSGFSNVVQDMNNYGLTDLTAAQIGFKDLDVSLRAIHHRANQLVNALHDIEQVTPVDVDDDDNSVQVISPPKSSIKRQSLDGLDSPPPTDKKMRASY